jgi:tripartite-type tricarboxylate transporter receptor subunit TctC
MRLGACTSSLFLLALVAVSLDCIEAVRAQAYPSRPIKIVVPFPPGGPTDVMARLIVQPMTSKLGQSVIVENQPGAGGRSGSRAVASANPDGYTLLIGGTNINAIIPALYKNLSYDPIKGYAAVAAIASDAGVLVVGPTVAAKTLPEFIQYAKDNPGKLQYGTAPGLGSHLSAELLKLKTGTDIIYIPYKGGAPAITDLIGGQIDMLFNNKSVLLALIQERKLRALAVTSAKRWPELPEVPTLGENGFDGFPSDSWYGLVAPAGTPAAVIDKLNAAVNDGLKSAELRASLAKLGIEARAHTPQEFATVLADQAAKYDAIVRSTGIKIE